MILSRSTLIAALALSASAHPSHAFTAYISNEKENTVTVLDTDKMEVTGTIKVGNRPRGITMTKDGKFILVCASDDDTIEVIDTATKQIVGSLPSGAAPEMFVLAP